MCVCVCVCEFCCFSWKREEKEQWSRRSLLTFRRRRHRGRDLLRRLSHRHQVSPDPICFLSLWNFIIIIILYIFFGAEIRFGCLDSVPLFLFIFSCLCGSVLKNNIRFGICVYLFFTLKFETLTLNPRLLRKRRKKDGNVRSRVLGLVWLMRKCGLKLYFELHLYIIYNSFWNIRFHFWPFHSLLFSSNMVENRSPI